VAIAEAIRNLPENPGKRDVIIAIASVCRRFNSGFDWDRFERACQE
jgi:hypothetical protein